MLLELPRNSQEMQKTEEHASQPPQGCNRQNPDGGKFYWTDGLVSTEKNVTQKKMKMEPTASKWLKRHKQILFASWFK